MSKPFFFLLMPPFLLDPEEKVLQFGATARQMLVFQNKWISSGSPIQMTLCFGLTRYECIKGSRCDCPFEGEISGASVPTLPRRGGQSDD